MEEVKSLAKSWNNGVVVPSLSTSLCMVSGPGALPLLRNLTNVMMIGGVHLLQALVHFIHQTRSHLGLQKDKMPMIILYELVDSVIKVIRIKMFAFHAEVSFDRYGKELSFIGICLGDFVIVT